MIRGQKRTIKSPDNLDIRASIHNRFDIEVVDSTTGKVKRTAQALNVVCNNLWTRLFTPAKYFNYIFYGGGTGTPSPTDTSLFSHIGYGEISEVTFDIDYTTGVYYRKGSIQLTASTAVGKTISEVGIGYGTGSSNLCTHAMLKDMNGNPISIDKTDTDVINIYATIYVHFERLGYDNNTIFLLKRDKNTAGQSPSLDIFSWASGAYASLPNTAYWSQGDTLFFDSCYESRAEIPSVYTAKSSVSPTLSASDKTVVFKFSRLEASSGNLDQGLRLVSFGAGRLSDTNHYRFHVPHMLIYPGGGLFPYSEIEGEAVGTGDGATQDFALDFAFPHDVRVYIDGVETTDFRVDYAPNSIEWLRYVRAIRPESTLNAIIPEPTRKNELVAGRNTYFYNPMWEIGIGSVSLSYTTATFEVSDDNSAWETITPSMTSKSQVYTYTIPEEYRHKKFWRVKNTSGGSSTKFSAIEPPPTFTGKCLHLNSPPAEGAVITADYKCDCFAKDSNHVLDMSVTIQFNEYTEAQ